jgi:hypothetical protein
MQSECQYLAGFAERAAATLFFTFFPPIAVSVVPRCSEFPGFPFVKPV